MWPLVGGPRTSGTTPTHKLDLLNWEGGVKKRDSKLGKGRKMRVNLGEEELGVNTIKIHCMCMYGVLLELMKILY